MEKPHLSESDLGLTDIKTLPDRITDSKNNSYQIKDGRAVPQNPERKASELPHQIKRTIEFIKTINLPKISGVQEKFARQISAEIDPKDPSRVHFILDAPYDLGEKKIDGYYDLEKFSDFCNHLSYEFQPDEGSFKRSVGVAKRLKLYDILNSDGSFEPKKSIFQ